MKRKDWISILAFIVILSIALIGQQFESSGSWINAAIKLALYSLPMLLLFVLAVIARHRKGSYVKFWRSLSYASFIVAFFLLFKGYSGPFMHYFNVTSSSSQDTIKAKAALILDDTDKMFVEYQTAIKKREDNYKNDLQTAINQGHQDDANSILRKALKNIPDYNKPGLAEKTAKEWIYPRIRNWEANNNAWKNKRTEFKNAFDGNLSIFTAAAQFKALRDQYTTYKGELTKDYAANCTEWEKAEGFDTNFTFANHESEWNNEENIFTKMKFNFGMFLLFIILALLASSSYIFFKDSSVKTPKQRNTTDNAVYQLGHKL